MSGWHVNVSGIEEKSYKIEIARDEGRFLSTTVSQLKTKIRETVNLEYDDMRLLYAGKQLVDYKTFGECYIEKGSTIICVLRVRSAQSESDIYQKQIKEKDREIEILKQQLTQRDAGTHKRPNMTKLMEVLCKEPGIQGQWKEIAIALGVENIDLEDKTSILSLNNVLVKWRDHPKGDKPFTYDTIIQALKGPIVCNSRKADEIYEII